MRKVTRAAALCALSAGCSEAFMTGHGALPLGARAPARQSSAGPTMRYIDFSDDDADMVRRRVNAIMEATPMHLITAYFEHAYEISDDFGPGAGHAHFPDQPEAELADTPVVDAGSRDDRLSSASPGVGAQEDPADVLARLQDMTGGPASWKDANPASSAPSIHLPAPSLDSFEDAKDVLARAYTWADPETPAGTVGAGSPPEGQEAREDVASILARAQSMTSKYMTGDDSAPLSPPPSVDTSKMEDPREVLARVNAWLAWTSPGTEATSDTAAAPSAAARGVHADDVLKRVSAAEASIRTTGPAHSAPLLQPPAAGGQEDTASILARAQGMAEALARVHASGQSASAASQGAEDLGAASAEGVLGPGGAAGRDAAATAEDVNRVLERVDAMMSKLEEKHARPSPSAPGAAVGSAQYEGHDEAAQDAGVLLESPAGILARAKAMAKDAIRAWAPSPTAAAPSTVPATWTASEAAAAAEGEDVKTVLARADAWMSLDAPAQAGLDARRAGRSDDGVSDVLRRVDAMMTSMDSCSVDEAGVGNGDCQGEEEDGWRDGRWARERTAKTCCSWEMQLVLRQQQQQHHNTQQHALGRSVTHCQGGL